MLALIMAGGAGTRLNLGEKPLISICGQPMISHVINAFTSAGCHVVVAASSNTPMTINWCRVQGIPWYKSKANGYIEDMASVITELEEEEPLFVSVSDIPCITSGIIRSIHKTYRESSTDALSVWIPSALVKTRPGGVPYRERINGIEACPAGVNILHGNLIRDVQEEIALLLDEPRLALNVNTRKDREDAEIFLQKNGQY